MTQEARVRPGGRIRIVRDATPNDSSKDFGPGAGKMWELKWYEAILAATATVGNRSLGCQVLQGANVVFHGPRHGAITASNTGYQIIGFGGGPTDDAAWSGVSDSIACAPEMWLNGDSAEILRIGDFAAIDANADDLTVSYCYVEYDI